MEPHHSAAKEAFEEAGVAGEVVELAVGSYRQRKMQPDGTPACIKVRAYPLEVHREMTDWPEKAERRRQWMCLSRAIDAVDPELRSVLEKFFKKNAFKTG